MWHYIFLYNTYLKQILTFSPTTFKSFIIIKFLWWNIYLFKSLKKIKLIILMKYLKVKTK